MKKAYFLLLTLLTFGSRAQTNYTDQLDAYMQAQVDVNRFNGNVLVAKNGQILYQKAFGYANYDTKAPLTLNSMFELGSVSKQFTAMSILLLQEQGKLSLSDSLRKFFPELPYRGITIRNLLTHTAGLPYYEIALKWDQQKIAFNPDMIRLLSEQKLPILFQPGQQWKYSNVGYALLASIVEKVSGQTFAQFTAQRIFEPLGMTRSRIYNTRRSSREQIPDYAYGYVYTNTLSRYMLPDSLPSYRFVYYRDGIQGAGKVNSTVGDLLKWDRALKNHTLLPETTQREMLTGQALSDTANKVYYGYGVGISRNDRGDVVSHSGSWPGYLTYLIRYVADDITIVVLSNNQSDVTGVSRALADMLFGKAVKLPRKYIAIDVEEKTLEDYVGEYQGPLGKNVVARSGNQLFYRWTNGNISKIFPETETRFFSKSPEAELEFVRDASGKVVKRIMTVNGQTSEAVKIK